MINWQIIKKVIFISILVLLASEMGLRLLDLLITGGKTRSLFSEVIFDDERGKYHLAPNTELIHPHRYGDVKYYFNEEGSRDDPLPVDKDIKKIVLIGDSVSFGLGVPYELIFSTLIEGLLNLKYEMSFAVIN